MPSTWMYHSQWIFKYICTHENTIWMRIKNASVAAAPKGTCYSEACRCRGEEPWQILLLGLAAPMRRCAWESAVWRATAGRLFSSLLAPLLALVSAYPSPLMVLCFPVDWPSCSMSTGRRVLYKKVQHLTAPSCLRWSQAEAVMYWNAWLL